MSTGLKKQIAQYAVEGVLGRGGMGVVYKARDPDGRAVALKVLNNPGSGENAARFAREAQIRLEHPNIVRLLGAGEDEDGSAYIAFELIEGETLGDRLRRGGVISAKEAVEIGVQVCRGLSAAHAAGIVHRDLKPSNLLVAKDGTIKVLDFGIAIVTFDDRLTMTGQVMGTPSYLAPEQARGESQLDARTDVWGLGMVLYEALTALRPFKRADSAVSTLLAVIMDELPPLREKAPEVPVDVAHVIERALEKLPDDRWPNAEAFAQALLDSTLSTARDAAPRARPLSLHEQRVVAILLAEGLDQPDQVQAAVESRAGAFIPLLGRRAIGLFGGEAWEGDEVARAAAAGISARGAAARMAVASGRAMVSGSRVSGAVVVAAEAGAQVQLAGLALSSDSAKALATDLPEVAPGVFELAMDRRLDLGADLRRPRPILGREAELAQIERVMRGAFESNQLGLVLLQGPAGVGKSLLLQHALRASKEVEPNVRLIRARAEVPGRERALSLFATALKSRVELSLRAPSERTPVQREKDRVEIERLAAEALRSERRRSECATFLGELLGVPMPESEPLLAARRDPGLMADRLRVALRDYFVGLSDQGPLALVLDDLQWADSASLALLTDVLDLLQDTASVVLLSARPELLEGRPGWLDGRALARIEPAGLRPSQVLELARSISGQRLDDALIKAITERTGGNPLFVEQIVRALADEERLDRSGEDLPLPLSVEAAVQSRLDHLPPSEKEALKRATIFGRPFTLEALGRVGVTDAARILSALTRRELIRRSGPARGTAVYRFHSSLVADVARRMLTDELAIELHLKAADAIARSAEPDAEAIALHLELGGKPREAAVAYADAVGSASVAGDSEAVARLSDRAIRLGVPEGRRFELFMARSDAFRFLGRRDDQALALVGASAAAGNDADRARVLSEEAFWLSGAGRSSESLASIEQAVALARAGRSSAVLALALGRRAMALLYAGQALAAKEALSEAEDILVEDRNAPRALLAQASNWRAQLAAALGDLSAARDAFKRALALYSEVGDVRRAAGAASNLADISNRVGAFREAEQALEEALENCRRVGHRVMEGYSLSNLGYALSAQGKATEAIAALDQAIAIGKAADERRLLVMARVYRARAAIERESPGELAEMAEEAARDAHELNASGYEASALAVAARAHLAAGNLSAALAASARALELRDRLDGLEEDEAEVFSVRADVLEAASRGQEAEALRAKARGRILQIAESIQDDSWRARFLQIEINRKLLGA